MKGAIFRTAALCLTGTVWATLVAVLTACGPGNSHLERVKAKNELLVVTRNSPTTYYEGPEGPAGLEYDLAYAFARHLGVKVVIETVPDNATMLERIAAGTADIAAGLTVNEERRKSVRFGPAYHEIRPVIVYRVGNRQPRDVADLIGKHIEIPAASDHIDTLNRLKHEYPALSWREIADVEPEDLLLSVAEGLLELTIADSDILSINRQYHPELQPAFAIAESQQLAWAFSADNDDSLHGAAASFFQHLRERELARLLDRYYGPTQRLDYVNTAHLLARIRDTLPAYRDVFVRAGIKYGLDWRLLAAIGYQESFWDPEAISRTGVKGIMMLTHQTSSYVGVTDREDPEQSIEGGARYLRSIINRMPASVLQPDRTWMALAAYNVGLGHLEDARVITEKTHGDPNKWHDIEARLPLLANSAWHKKTRHGYARGYEPVQFVRRIRTYYNTLVKYDEDEKERNSPVILRLKAPAL